MLHKAWNSKGEMPYCFPRSTIKFQGHTGQNITDFDPNWAFPVYKPVPAFKSLRFAMLLLRCIRKWRLQNNGNFTILYVDEILFLTSLTHIGRVTYIYQWNRPPMLQIILVAYLAPTNYLNQCWLIVNLTLCNKLQGNLKKKCNSFI